MRIEDLKQRILSNDFVDQVRISMKFNDTAFDELRSCLQELATALKGQESIDRELMLSLYVMPIMVRNVYLSFGTDEPLPPIAARLEDAWVELDELVTSCLAD